MNRRLLSVMYLPGVRWTIRKSIGIRSKDAEQEKDANVTEKQTGSLKETETGIHLKASKLKPFFLELED